MSTGCPAGLVERWREVPGFDGWYEASDLGRIRSWRTPAKRGVRSLGPRILTGTATAHGYHAVKLTHPVLGKLSVFVHHLVLAAWRGQRPDGLVCDHINAVRTDNRITNLRWVTCPENLRHGFRMGRMDCRPGGRAHSPLDEASAAEIRRRRAEGARLVALAKEFGVSKSTVSRIARGESWKVAS